MPALSVAMRACAVMLGATLLSACSTIVPSGSGPATASNRAPTTQPLPSAPVAATPSAPAARPQLATPGTPIPAPSASTAATTARAAGVVAGPDIASLGITRIAAIRALAAFRLSCNVVTRRADGSGLTQPGDWTAACAAARSANDDGAERFFNDQFRAVQVGDGRAFATGYYEPEILGSRTRRAGYEHPVYALPPDLVEIDLSQFSDTLAGRRIRGRLDGGRFVPYADRAAIDRGALSGRNLEIAWVADPIEFFFLQVQGSGRLRLPDGGVMRIGYAGQNGHDYVGIGRLLRDRGVLQPGQASMQGLIDYMRSQPDGGTSIMHENPSWVFFRELTGPGPLGALNIPVTPRGSVAADPLFVPLGAPVVLAMDRAEPNGLWIAQDTGGAIRGSNRFDTFWGEGAEARALAGGMAARGTALILLPTASVSRLLNGQ
jgi:membrane-bound lytic murein transglycosylase A